MAKKQKQPVIGVIGSNKNTVSAILIAISHDMTSSEGHKQRETTLGQFRRGHCGVLGAGLPETSRDLLYPRDDRQGLHALTWIRCGQGAKDKQTSKVKRNLKNVS